MRVGLLIGVVGAALAFASVAQAVDPACPQGTTMAVAAHQDDVLLFMGSELAQDVQRGRCVRLVFTSSGARTNVSFMHDLEAGIEASYAELAGVPDSWTHTFVRQDDHWMAEARLDGDSKVSIDYLSLDTNDPWPVGSSNSAADGDPSLLEALERGWTDHLTTIDGPTTYTRQDVIDVLAQLMRRYQPSRVDTEDFVEHYGFGDHSDHRATAFLTYHAWKVYGQGVLASYQGYDMGRLPVNVTGDDYAVKLAAWMPFTPHDGNVPQGVAANQADQFYGNWLQREYVLTTLAAVAHRHRRAIGCTCGHTLNRCVCPRRPAADV